MTLTEIFDTYRRISVHRGEIIKFSDLIKIVKMSILDFQGELPELAEYFPGGFEENAEVLTTFLKKPNQTFNVFARTYMIDEKKHQIYTYPTLSEREIIKSDKDYQRIFEALIWAGL